MNSKMNLFNFYLDDDDKQKAIEKLNRLLGEQSKGQLASLLRILLKKFIATPDDKVNPLLIDAISAEFTYTKTKNKRSNL